MDDRRKGVVITALIVATIAIGVFIVTIVYFTPGS